MQVGLTPEAEKLLPEFCTKVVAALAERDIATAQPVA